ncbi:MAG: hypothetical protein ACI94Y_001449 [Maribacter sp.]|jgi:hypothetical protein
MALGIKCFEIYLNDVNLHDDLRIIKILNILWKFTSSNQFDEWGIKISTYNPDN